MSNFTPKQLATLTDVLWRYPALKMRAPKLAQVLVWLACSGQTDFADLQSIVAWGIRCVRVEQDRKLRILELSHHAEQALDRCNLHAYHAFVEAIANLKG